MLRRARRSASRCRARDVDFARVHDACARRHRGDRAERFAGALHRPRRAGDRGAARFTGRRHGRGRRRFAIKARRFVIATGSSPAMPPIPGLAETPYLTNETIFDLAACPRHLVVIGAGRSGSSWRRRSAGSARRSRCSKPRRRSPTTIRNARAIVLDQLAREGVVIRARRRRSRASSKQERQGAGRHRRRRSGEETIEGSHLLVATGRTAEYRRLGLERPASSTTRAASWSTSACAPPTGGSTRSATSPAGRSSPMSPNYHAGIVIRHALFRLPVGEQRRRSRG